MAAAEGAEPILQRGEVSPGRHLVVDRRGGVQRDAPHDPRPRGPTPPAPDGDGSCYGPKIGTQAVEFRVAVVALAEEEGVAGAVDDVRHANAAVKPEDAVAGHAGKSRRTACKNRP